MKAKEKQVKVSKKYDRMSVTTLPIHKQSEIEIHHWLNYIADKLGDIIKQIESIQKGLRQVASLVRAKYLLSS